MPIKPENKHRYPADWPEIRERIRKRAGDRCEKCGVANGAIGVRDSKGVFHEMGLAESEAAILDGENVIRIGLTLAHVHDKRPENCAEDNLAFWCQRCHLHHDIDDRVQSCIQTARAKERAAGQLPLFSTKE